MRRIITILGICMLGVIGCKHVGGKCDCGPSAGDKVTYAPNPPVVTTAEAIGTPKAPMPLPMPK